MSYRGVVRNGKVEFDPAVELPEGTVVTIEVRGESWLAEMRKLGEDVTKSTPPGVSILEELRRSRR